MTEEKRIEEYLDKGAWHAICDAKIEIIAKERRIYRPMTVAPEENENTDLWNKAQSAMRDHDDKAELEELKEDERGRSDGN